MQMILCFLLGLNLMSLDVKGSDDLFSKDDFPENFVFGAASSAYQWEGAADEDGRKPSIWDTFAKSKTKSDGDKTCDGYHKYKEDVELMVETGLDAFRLSISWSRLIPNGRGFVNPKGLLFYKNLINQLISNGIEPHVTLHHNDVPQALENEYGGWLDRRIIEDFRAYADVCFREFGDSVKHWTSINEANVFAMGGYADGISPPGHCSPNSPLDSLFPGSFLVNCSKGNSSTEPYLVLHHLLLAHASVATLYRHKYKDIQQGSLGISLYVFGFSPYTNTNDDVVATQRAKDFFFGWVLDPLMFGDYPDEIKRRVGSRLPVFTEKESELVKGSIDFRGVLHYTTLYIRKKKIIHHSGFYADMGVEIQTDIGNSSLLQYGVLPWGMEEVLEYIKQSYGNPTIILENGEATPGSSLLTDKLRVEYIQAYIGAVLNAIRNGSDIRGYFVWSLMDMYELLSGYNYSFGLYYVNFSDPLLKRSPKLSANWYSAFLKGTKTTTLASSRDLHKALSFSQ